MNDLVDSFLIHAPFFACLLSPLFLAFIFANYWLPIEAFND